MIASLSVSPCICAITPRNIADGVAPCMRRKSKSKRSVAGMTPARTAAASTATVANGDTTRRPSTTCARAFRSANTVNSREPTRCDRIQHAQGQNNNCSLTAATRLRESRPSSCADVVDCWAAVGSDRRIDLLGFMCKAIPAPRLASMSGVVASPAAAIVCHSALSTNHKRRGSVQSVEAVPARTRSTHGHAGSVERSDKRRTQKATQAGPAFLRDSPIRLTITDTTDATNIGLAHELASCLARVAVLSLTPRTLLSRCRAPSIRLVPSLQSSSACPPFALAVATAGVVAGCQPSTK